MERYSLKKDNRGAAMITCIIIITILMIFCFSLLSVSYSFYSSQNNTMQEERNAEAAKSLAMSLQEELTADSEDSNLCKYLRYNICTEGRECWPHYAPEEAGHEEADAKRYFNIQKSDAASIAGFPSQANVCMWWTKPDTEADPEAKVHLFVEVESVSGSQSYVIRSEYELLTISKRSSYVKMSTQKNINPAQNTIDKNVVWRWRLVERE